MTGRQSTAPKTHPHAEAGYRVIRLQDGAFGVEVTIPETSPTIVTRFVDEAAAEAWIADHRRRVLAPAQPGGWFRKAGMRRG